MNASEEPNVDPTIRDFIAANDVAKAAAYISRNPKALFKDPSLLKEARTPLMVETLLLLTNEVDGHFQSYDVIDKQPTQDREKAVDSVSMKDENDFKETSMQAVKRVFPILMEKWPATLLKVLDKQINYEGTLFYYDLRYKLEVYSLQRSLNCINGGSFQRLCQKFFGN